MPHDLVKRVMKEGSPLVSAGDALFVWEGKHPPVINGDFNDWEGEPLTFSETGHGAWTASLPLPPDAYIEYTFTRAGAPLPDPYNRRTVSNGMGQRNHYFYMPAAGPSPLAKRQKDVPRGQVDHFRLPTGELLVGKKRDVYLYHPPADGPYPLLVAWDGGDYLHRAHLARIADNLIAARRVRPFGMALVENGGPARLVEYACSEAVLAFLEDMVLPLAYDELDLLDIDAQSGCFGILGASMGGLMALFAGLRMPAVFGKVLSQSGAFSHVIDESVVYDLVAQSDRDRLQAWLDVGAYETLLAPNRRMKTLLASRGLLKGYYEYPAGHNYTAWSNDLWRGLEALFPVEGACG